MKGAHFTVHRDPSRPYGSFLLYVLAESLATIAQGELVMKSNVRPEADIQVMTPAATMDSTQAQELMDSLWTAGIRPSEGSGSAGQKAALEAHLADTKKILDMTLPLALRKPE